MLKVITILACCLAFNAKAQLHNIAFLASLDEGETIWVPDSDADDFLTRAGITDEVESNAVTILTISLKSHGLWDIADLIYPMCGSTSNAISTNLKTNEWPIMWNSSGVTYDTNGVAVDGVDGYGAPTNYLLSTSANWTFTNSAFMFYSGSNGYSGLSCMDGSLNRAALTRSGSSMAASGLNCNNAGGFGFAAPSGDFQGPMMLSRLTTNQQIISIRGSATTNSDFDAVASPATSMGIGARRLTSSWDYPAPGVYRGMWLGAGLTMMQASNLFNAFDVFNQSLGRKVP